MYYEFSDKLKKAYNIVLSKIGDPLNETTLYSPLHCQRAVNAFEVSKFHIFLRLNFTFLENKRVLYN